MSSVAGQALVITSTVHNLVREDPGQKRIVLGLLVLSYMFVFRSVIIPIAHLVFILVKMLIMLLILRPYYTIATLLSLAFPFTTGRTHAILVASACLCWTLASPDEMSTDLSTVSQHTENINYVLGSANDSLTGRLYFDILKEGLVLPSSIDPLKLACLGVVMIAAIQQSIGKPKPTMLDAFLMRKE